MSFVSAISLCFANKAYIHKTEQTLQHL